MIELLINVILPSLIASLGWGISPYFDKKALEYLDTHSILLYRNLLVGVLSIIIYLFFKNKIKFDNKIKKSFKYVLFGSLSAIVGFFFYYKALSKTKNTTLVVLISYVMPLIFITFISHYFLKEKFNLGMIAGLLIVIVGIMIFTYCSK